MSTEVIKNVQTIKGLNKYVTAYLFERVYNKQKEKVISVIPDYLFDIRSVGGENIDI